MTLTLYSLRFILPSSRLSLPQTTSQCISCVWSWVPLFQFRWRRKCCMTSVSKSPWSLPTYRVLRSPSTTMVRPARRPGFTLYQLVTVDSHLAYTLTMESWSWDLPWMRLSWITQKNLYSYLKRPWMSNLTNRSYWRLKLNEVKEYHGQMKNYLNKLNVIVIKWGSYIWI